MEEERTDNQKLILRILGSRSISFNPDLAKLVGDVGGGLFLSQLLYWSSRGRDPEWFYKTIDELEEETLLSRTQQLRAQKKCVALGILDVKLRGLPRKRHFRVNIETLVSLLEEIRRNETIRRPP